MSLTLLPALLLLAIEGTLRLLGYGHSSRLFVPAENGTFVENPQFGLRFFPPGLNRALNPMVLPGAKQAGTYRIFIFGESAARGHPDSSFHFGRLLQVMLEDRYPATNFEVINTAMVAVNSYVILPIARECAEHEPDLYVVYMGNNEVVGPFGAAGVLGPFIANGNVIRASIALKATRTGQLLANVGHRLTYSGPTHYAWGGMSMFVESQVEADDPRLAGVYAHFAENLRDICAAGRNGGAKVVVCTLATNLKDSAPFASASVRCSAAEQTAAWQSEYEAGIARESAGDFAAALECYRRAEMIDGGVADVHFRLGRCLSRLKQHADAHGHYVRARDLDTLRFRADTPINDILRKFAEGGEEEGIYVADVERSFERLSSDGNPGEELLYEHVHLTFQGNYWLARTVLEQVERLLPDSMRSSGPATPGPLSLEECKERLPFTIWNQRKAVEDIIALGEQPPFPNQLDHAERLRRWKNQLAELKKSLGAGGMAEAEARYEQALERNPRDFALVKDFAMLRWEQGQLDEAAALLKQALQLVPHDAVQHSRLAQVLALLGKLDLALASAATSARLRPADPQMHNTLGRLLLKAGKANEAATAFWRSLRLNPEIPETHLHLGHALVGQKRFTQAEAQYEEALRLRPGWAEAKRAQSQLRQFRDAAPK